MQSYARESSESEILICFHVVGEFSMKFQKIRMQVRLSTRLTWSVYVNSIRSPTINDPRLILNVCFVRVFIESFSVYSVEAAQKVHNNWTVRISTHSFQRWKSTNILQFFNSLLLLEHNSATFSTSERWEHPGYRWPAINNTMNKQNVADIH